MKIHVNKENVKTFLKDHTFELAVFGLAAVVGISTTVKDYVTRENAAGYAVVTSTDRVDRMKRMEFVEEKKEINKKYVYEDTEKLDEILEKIEAEDYAVTYTHEKNGTVSLNVELLHPGITQEKYKEFNKQLSKLFSNINISSLTLDGLDLSKLDSSFLKKIKVNKLVLMNCTEDFDYKYFDTSKINELWLYGREGYQEKNQHYDLKEYSYTKELIITGDASFKNLEKMTSLEDFTLFNYEDMKENEYNQIVSSLNQLYAYKLLPFSSICLHNAPSSKFILPPADFIAINNLSYDNTCDIVVNTNHLSIDNMRGKDTKISVSGYIGESFAASSARIHALNINDINKYGYDIKYSFVHCSLDMSLEEINDKMKDVDFSLTRLTNVEEGELVKTENGIKVAMSDSKVYRKQQTN